MRGDDALGFIFGYNNPQHPVGKFRHGRKPEACQSISRWLSARSARHHRKRFSGNRTPARGARTLRPLPGSVFRRCIPVVATAARSYHRLMDFHPFGMKECQRGAFAEVSFRVAIRACLLEFIAPCLQRRAPYPMEKMPATAFQPSQPHAALIWLIRGTGALIALCSTIIAFLVVAYQFKRPDIDGFISILFVLLLGFISKRGYDMFRRVDAATVSTFAFISAIIVAIAFYHILPEKIPQIVTDHIGGFLFMHRSTVAVIAFFGFNKVIKAFLLRILELNPPAPPQNAPPSDPVEPFVPFDPYDLSKNRPIHPQ
jgi:hypothetical protein